MLLNAGYSTCIPKIGYFSLMAVWRFWKGVLVRFERNRARLAELTILSLFYVGLAIGILWAVTVLAAVLLTLLSIWSLTFTGGIIGYLLSNLEKTVLGGIAAVTMLTWNHRRSRKRIGFR